MSLPDVVSREQWLSARLLLSLTMGYTLIMML